MREVRGRPLGIEVSRQARYTATPIDRSTGERNTDRSIDLGDGGIDRVPRREKEADKRELPAEGEGQCMFADKAIEECKGIVDLGCSDSMGGAYALDVVANLNYQK